MTCYVERVGRAKAADDLEITLSYLSKLCSGRMGLDRRVKNIGSGTFGKLARELPAAELKELQLAVLEQSRASALRTHREWLFQQLARVGGAPAVVNGVSGSLRRGAPADKVVTRLRVRYPAHFARLEKAVASWPDLDVEREARLALAEYRVVAPLVGGPVERTIEELEQSGELVAYLQVAITAECILLKRAPADQRVKAVPAGERRQQRERRKETCP
jgi:hypothetical protein